jgi:hypothetical protein
MSCGAGVLAPVAPLVLKAFPGRKDPITVLRAVRAADLVHGTRDAVIAHDHSVQLHAANAPKELWMSQTASTSRFGNPGPWRERLAAALEAAVR